MKEYVYHLLLNENAVCAVFFKPYEDNFISMEISFHVTVENLKTPYLIRVFKEAFDELKEEDTVNYINSHITSLFHNEAIPNFDIKMKRSNELLQISDFQVMVCRQYFGFGKGAYIYIDGDNQLAIEDPYIDNETLTKAVLNQIEKK